MRFWMLVGLAATAAGAFAAGYDDFAMGVEANEESKSDIAIASFTKALKDGDLAATYVPTAYYGRAIAYLRKQNCFLSRNDASEAIRLKPDYFDAYLLRVNLDNCMHDDEAQAADIAAGLALKPDVTLLKSRAILKWRKGDFAGSAGDFAAAAKAPPLDTSLYLWSAAALMHAGTYDPAGFAQRTADVRSRDWPGPVFDLYLGKSTPEAVLVRIAKDDPAGRELRKCQADFFIGEWHLWRLEKDAAKSEFFDAANECRGTVFLRRMAMLEYTKLN